MWHPCGQATCRNFTFTCDYSGPLRMARGRRESKEWVERNGNKFKHRCSCASRWTSAEPPSKCRATIQVPRTAAAAPAGAEWSQSPSKPSLLFKTKEDSSRRCSSVSGQGEKHILPNSFLPFSLLWQLSGLYLPRSQEMSQKSKILHS